MNRAVKTYSKGMKQRLGLAQAFLGAPKLLLLDEPTVGLDPIATKEFYQSVDKLKSDGASIILCSHVLPGVEQHIDRALILGSGKALAMGTLAELRQQANLPVAIRTHGLNGSLQHNAALNGFMVGADLLHVSEAQKMAVMRQLLSFESLKDIQLEPADLGCLYQHFLSQAADKSAVKPHSAQEGVQS
jgi:Cu-processing system ATP-binding protein